eukprot:5856701-Lingulodinium_polyedra.AAC.1
MLHHGPTGRRDGVSVQHDPSHSWWRPACGARSACANWAAAGKTWKAITASRRDGPDPNEVECGSPDS